MMRSAVCQVYWWDPHRVYIEVFFRNSRHEVRAEDGALRHIDDWVWRIPHAAFVVYVRPILEYLSPVWFPSTVTYINKLESVQRSFYRAMHVVLARYCYRKSSVRPSVRPSVCP